MTYTDQDNLPRIACFHGGGSSAAIYETQCSFLTPLLANEFQFEFFEGPFESPAGPGVLPAFAGFEPYKTWFYRVQPQNQSNGHHEKQDEADVLDQVWKMLEERRGGKGGEWVGVMGFSEGSRVAGGLLLDQQRREEKGLPLAGDSIRLRFGLMCMGGGAPMNVECDGFDNKPIIRIPTLHMHGLRDPFLGYGRDQFITYYDPSTASLFEVDYHHAMPWLEKESNILAERIRGLYDGKQSGLKG